ncbi:phosphotransferase [Paenibacillus lycopersici]|uniref:Phosphotransferase n=1 Tax=Paenibacillus lycopersici TaxID=2704462 RepID=A0A6C0FUG7_9BACL|nr:phosphotransferase [Paenibacillus lycopersici]QHT58569.1 phosphotransferase [Paenibacillus lycopersici]
MGSDTNPNMPDAAILKALNAKVEAPLGGRLNRHWLVNVNREQLVLRLWHGGVRMDDIDYEAKLLQGIAGLGWPVAPVIGEPIAQDGQVWGLFPFLRGEPPSVDNPAAEQRARGRLLAQFHQDLLRLGAFGQRRGWRRCEEILFDEGLDRLLSAHEQERPEEEMRMLRWHLERARKRAEGLRLHDRPGIVTHGDFTTWNLRFQGDRLTGILDFELAHWDHRVGEFALAWRGKYDEVILGYDEVSPLEPDEWELITPMWWAGLIELACNHLKEGSWDDGWMIRKLLERSPLMGPDAVPYR